MFPRQWLESPRSCPEWCWVLERRVRGRCCPSPPPDWEHLVRTAPAWQPSTGRWGAGRRTEHPWNRANWRSRNLFSKGLRVSPQVGHVDSQEIQYCGREYECGEYCEQTRNTWKQLRNGKLMFFLNGHRLDLGMNFRRLRVRSASRSNYILSSLVGSVYSTTPASSCAHTDGKNASVTKT